MSTIPQCIHIPDGSVAISGEVFDNLCGLARQQAMATQEIEQLTQQLADMTSDYQRRNRDAVDRYEEIERLKAHCKSMTEDRDGFYEIAERRKIEIEQLRGAIATGLKELDRYNLRDDQVLQDLRKALESPK